MTGRSQTEAWQLGIWPKQTGQLNQSDQARARCEEEDERTDVHANLDSRGYQRSGQPVYQEERRTCRSAESLVPPRSQSAIQPSKPGSAPSESQLRRQQDTDPLSDSGSSVQGRARQLLGAVRGRAADYWSRLTGVRKSPLPEREIVNVNSRLVGNERRNDARIGSNSA